ncbi:SDR family NAD(P)-dependent oxidoreductase [Pseudarthrobacter siccitolerans]|uniref:SDR family NAD(P)-dependent oxidoreductase n=1 Tax=Pseudarthrobacter siccitolerans TaxID=861266 RepID=UPI0006793BAB|nr:SDR family oxidoreductase [Pseudarthrobacter siccitolerans]
MDEVALTGVGNDPYNEVSAQPSPAQNVDHASLFSLKGRVYAVLGAGGGIGEHVTRTIVGMGGRVLCVDINLDGVSAVADSLQMPFLVSDVTTEEGMNRIARLVAAKYGQIDGYVDVIGQMHRRSISDYGLADWDLDFKVNLAHAFLAARSLAPLVTNGSIVHVSSVVGSHGGLVAPGYGPSKAALQVWVKQLAAEHGSRGVRVNAVAPGLFLSPRYVAKERTSRDTRILAGRPLLGRLGQPYEIAATIAFLLSPAAGYITGTTIPIEGGTLSRDSTGLDELAV